MKRKNLKKMLLIIDGNNMAYRARYAYNLSHPNTNMDVSVTYGILRMLSSLMEKYTPTSVMVCWDGGIPDFRRVAVPEYKANRHKSDDPTEYQDFLRQLVELENTLPVFGIASVRKVGCEADDLMYHASRLYIGNSIIVTSDKDLLQAVNENVGVYNPSGDFVHTLDGFEDRIGIDRKNYIHWRAIQGDGSDNIPGVRGIGAKTATKLFKEFSSITGIVNAAHGRNPVGEPTPKIKAEILNFGWDRICKNIYAMVLAYDRTGAKEAVLESLENYHRINEKKARKYLLGQAFLSLVDSGIVTYSKRLIKPAMDLEDKRIPVVCARKFPIE